MGHKVGRTGGVVLVLVLAGAFPAAGAETLNDKVLAHARAHKGERVGDGECATLATAALRHAGGRTRGLGAYVWGRLLTAREPMLPGDILQFESARFEHRARNSSSYQTYPHHTAIVARVAGKKITVLHQNVTPSKIVVTTTINLAEKTRGTVKAYRPLPRK